MAEKEDYFRIGVITEPHGVQGEVKVYPTTDDVLHLKKVKEIYLQTKEGWQTLHLKDMKQQNDRIILRFAEFTDRNAVEGLRKLELYVDRAHAVPLEENEYYISDLIGLAVFEDDVQIGEVTDVIETGANDVYQIKRTDGTELLLPAIKQCVLKVDVEGGRMDVSVMEGL
ncbi:MAG: 16S rRNA processing protein RimM [Lachnospiraceae bacterium]|nr:16S rRNA processing protein RimM [Lachnospiraceae bacterium]